MSLSGAIKDTAMDVVYCCREQNSMKSLWDISNVDEIIGLLQSQHCIRICLRTLKKRFKCLGLSRKYSYTNENVRKVESTVLSEIQGSSSDMGYRSVWHHLRCNRGVFTSRNFVMRMIKNMDPEGVSRGRRHRLKCRSYRSDGPNDCWHLDGYDKLKPFGFPIHGCIDGFSRKILWLKLVPSNNDPSLIGELYLNCIAEMGVVPKKVRTDCGSENVIVAAAQCFFRRNGADTFAGEKAHIYGSSHSNQRIEAWWSHFRRCKWVYYKLFQKHHTNWSLQP